MPLDAFFYQYAIGGPVFVVGLVFAWREGYVGPRGRPLLNLVLLVGGLALFAGIQAYLQYAPMETHAPVAYEGTPLDRGELGTPLDYGIMIAYFVMILAVGTYYGRNQKDTKDFFFGGQRFSWWLIAFSLVATTVGSYSFVKYSRIAYTYGIGSSQTYLNDWFWLPLFLFGWLPILYFSRLTSIPEYFGRRFGPGARQAVTALLLLYLIGYVGVNLYTMGTALNILLGWDVRLAALIVATISAIYVTFGGQTSVIMTDLLQGVMLLATGLVVLILGIDYLGGIDSFWEHLPRGHRLAFPNFNEDPAYNSVGIFWQDAMANTAVFYFLNQGIMMRFVAARSVREGRRAGISVLLILMPIAAVVVASGGWVGKALAHAGALPPDMDGGEVFFQTAAFLARPGIFGLIMAALTAALMSTIDTLITGIAAIVVNDVYKPHINPQASERSMLRVARFSSVGTTILGLAMVPALMEFKSIYAAHGAFTAAVTPPLVVAMLLGVFWRRYTPKAAVWTVVGGFLAITLSIAYPVLVEPFSQGVPLQPVDDGGLLSGMRQYKFVRAFYGLTVSAAIGIVVTLFTRPRPVESLRGLVWGTVADAIRSYKGGPGEEKEGAWIRALPARAAADCRSPKVALAEVRLSPQAARDGDISAGDLVYVSDTRWWLGGLRSSHGIVSEVSEALGPEAAVELGPSTWEAVVAPSRKARELKLKKLY